MWIGVGNLAAAAMVTEQRAESGHSHGLSAPASFQRNEQGGGIGGGPFQAEIALEDGNEFVG